MIQQATADVEVALGTVAAAVAELRDALETMAGMVDLEGEAVYVGANLDKLRACSRRRSGDLADIVEWPTIEDIRSRNGRMEMKAIGVCVCRTATPRRLPG
jgi:hypothetical protein